MRETKNKKVMDSNRTVLNEKNEQEKILKTN